MLHTMLQCLDCPHLEYTSAISVLQLEFAIRPDLSVSVPNLGSQFLPIVFNSTPQAADQRDFAFNPFGKGRASEMKDPTLQVEASIELVDVLWSPLAVMFPTCRASNLLSVRL